MITLEAYLADPCGRLSIPYWKWKRMVLPENMRICHHREFAAADGYEDTVYFRLRHDLKGISSKRNRDVRVRQADPEDYDAMVRIIRQAYPGIRFDTGDLLSMTQTRVYAPALWLVAEMEGRIAGCLIGDMDREIREGILEWVQVLPEFQRRGVGRALVTEALCRMDADFATVSGHTVSAEGLYRGCGFYGDDRWHILRKL